MQADIMCFGRKWAAIGFCGVAVAAAATAAAETNPKDPYENLFADYAAAAPAEKTQIIEQILATNPLAYERWKGFADAFARHSETILADYEAPADDAMQFKVCELLALYCADVRVKLDYDEQLPRRISDRLVADFLKRPKGAALLKGHLAILAQVPFWTKGISEAARIVREYVDSPDPDIQARAITAYSNLCGQTQVPERQQFVAREYDKLVAFLRKGELKLPVLRILSLEDCSAYTQKDLDLFLPFLKDRENRPSCEAAIGIVGCIQNPRSEQALLDVVRAPPHGSDEARFAALCLKALGNLDAVPILTDRLEQELTGWEKKGLKWPMPYYGSDLNILDEITGQQPISIPKPVTVYNISGRIIAEAQQRIEASESTGTQASTGNGAESPAPMNTAFNAYTGPVLTQDQVKTAVAFYRDFWKKRQTHETQHSPKDSAD